MNGPGSTNTLIIAVVVVLVVSLGAAVFFWWRSMYGVWSAKRRPRGPGTHHTTADGSPIVIIPGMYDTGAPEHTHTDHAGHDTGTHSAGDAGGDRVGAGSDGDGGGGGDA